MGWVRLIYSRPKSTPVEYVQPGIHPRENPNARKRKSFTALQEAGLLFSADRAGVLFFSWESSPVKRYCWTQDRWLWKCNMKLQLCSCCIVKSLKLYREEDPQVHWVRIPAKFGESKQGVLKILQNNGNSTNLQPCLFFFFKLMII